MKKKLSAKYHKLNLQEKIMIQNVTFYVEIDVILKMS